MQHLESFLSFKSSGHSPPDKEDGTAGGRVSAGLVKDGDCKRNNKLVPFFSFTFKSGKRQLKQDNQNAKKEIKKQTDKTKKRKKKILTKVSTSGLGIAETEGKYLVKREIEKEEKYQYLVSTT